MERPELNEFGITSEEYKRYRQNKPPFSEILLENHVFIPTYILIACLVPIIVFILTRDLALAIAWAFLGFFASAIAAGIVLMILSFPLEGIRQIQKIRVSKSLLATKIERYEEAEATYRKIQREAERTRREAERIHQESERTKRRKLRDHWMSLGGIQFERELATLYRQLGYTVESTPTTGDQGVDLVLKKRGKTTVVQCKSHKQPVGPAVARELYGALIASGANDAILACTSGFTKGVRDFVRGKPIALISAVDLATMGEGVNESEVHYLSSSISSQEVPVCPNPGCGSKMVLRNGKYGRFWGCQKYPNCRGTRDSVDGTSSKRQLRRRIKV